MVETILEAVPFAKPRHHLTAFAPARVTSLDFVANVERLHWNGLQTWPILTTTNCRPWARIRRSNYYIQSITACPSAVIGD
jgi:hypothetical protein